MDILIKAIITALICLICTGIWYYVIVSFIQDVKDLKKKLKEHPVSKKGRNW